MTKAKVSKLGGALSPVNHRGLHQGCKAKVNMWKMTNQSTPNLIWKIFTGIPRGQKSWHLWFWVVLLVMGPNLSFMAKWEVIHCHKNAEVSIFHFYSVKHDNNKKREKKTGMIEVASLCNVIRFVDQLLFFSVQASWACNTVNWTGPTNFQLAQSWNQNHSSLIAQGFILMLQW